MVENQQLQPPIIVHRAAYHCLVSSHGSSFKAVLCSVVSKGEQSGAYSETVEKETTKQKVVENQQVFFSVAFMAEREELQPGHS